MVLPVDLRLRDAEHFVEEERAEIGDVMTFQSSTRPSRFLTVALFSARR